MRRDAVWSRSIRCLRTNCWPVFKDWCRLNATTSSDRVNPTENSMADRTDPVRPFSFATPFLTLAVHTRAPHYHL